MMKICVCGHFGFGLELLNGQTIKTKVISEELEKKYNQSSVLKIDTHGLKNILILPLKLLIAMFTCKNMIILPAQRALALETIYLCILNVFFRRNIHYIVIGGWIINYIEKHSIVAYLLKSYKGIYVELQHMKEQLVILGYHNVYILPNCKKNSILDVDKIEENQNEKFKLVIFSRIMKEKGISYAIEAIKKANRELNDHIFQLDLYGEVDSKQHEWFEREKQNFSNDVHYRGKLPYDKCVDVLCKYHMLLFPTYYEGEGLPGTIIDAYASGLPVIASDWKYNASVVINGKTGCLFKPHDVDDLKDKMIQCYKNPTVRIKMRYNCIQQAKLYMPEIALKPLFENL